MSSEVTTRSRYAGAVVGQALGDAAGFPVEGAGPKPCAQYVDEVLRTDLAGDIGRAGFPFGQYTDDTQLMRELLLSYVDLGRLDPADYARRVGALFSTGAIVGRGRATEAAALRLLRGVPWDEAGSPPPSAGNGSAMRAAAVALIYPNDPDALVAAARVQSRVTHQDPRCAAGAIAIAAATARGLRGETYDPRALCDELGALTAGDDPLLSEWLGRLPFLLDAPEADVAASIARLGQDPEVGEAWHGISPFVTPSVLWSVYAFLRHPTSYWDAVCAAIRVGGDVDTTAAMTGAIAGAHVGLEALPPLARRVTDQGAYDYDALVDLAHQVLAARGS